jgi:hypothetical protein
MKLAMRVFAVIGLLVAFGFYVERMTRITPQEEAWLDTQILPDGHGGYVVRSHLVPTSELNRRVTALVNYEAAASAGVVAHLVIEPSAATKLADLISKERALCSVGALGAFSGGYLLGRITEPSLQTPEFEKTLHDPGFVQTIRSEKMKALQARNNAETTRLNLAALSHGETPSPQVQSLARDVQHQLAGIYVLNPEFREIPN